MELIKLLTGQAEKKLVGTLTLGKTNNFREVFFQGELVYLVGEHFSGRVALRKLAQLGIPGQRVSMEAFDKIIHEADRSRRVLAEHLYLAEKLSEAELAEAAHEQILEELLHILCQTRQTFHFDEGRVPEYLLHCEDLTVRVPLGLEEVIASLRKRVELWSRFEAIVPSRDEIFVLTERGMTARQTPGQDTVLSQTLRLIDGMRDLRSLLKDTFLYESNVASALIVALDSGLIKKTIHPELKGLSTHSFQRPDAERYLPWFKNAVKYGVDELAARERLAVVYEKLGRIDDAIIQFNYIGDSLYRMRKAAKAMKAFQRALQLKPDEILVTEKITRIYSQAAAEELAGGNKDQAVQFLLGAIKIRPGDRDSFAQVLPLLVSERRLEELSDLCDWICAHARKARTPDIAVQTCKDILAELPQNAAFRKKLINIYFDFGMHGEASAELQVLAKQYLERGQAAKAQELLEKVRRIGGTIDSELRVLERQFLSQSKVRRRGPWALVAAAIVGGVAIYQVYTYWLWVKIAGATATAEAAAERTVQPGFLGRTRDEERCLGLAAECDVFLARHPLSLWRVQARITQTRLRDRARSQELLRVTRKRETLQAATVTADEGNKAEAAQILAPVLQLPEGDPAREAARRILAMLGSEERSAADLLGEARRLEAEGDARGAWRMYRRLADAYPRSSLVADLRVPVVIESIPTGADAVDRTNQRESAPLGKTPIVVALELGGAMQVELSSPGYEPQRIEVQESDGKGKLHYLVRRRTGAVALGGRAEPRPLLTGDALFCGMQAGGLVRVAIADGKVERKLRAETGKTLVSAPVLTPHCLATAWNNGNLILQPPPPFLRWPDGSAGEGPDARVSIFLGSLATTPLLALSRSELLAVGTKSGQVSAYHSRTHAQAWSFEVGSTPEVLADLQGDLIVAAQGGTVIRLRTREAAGVGWKRQVPATGNGGIHDLLPTDKSILAVTRRGDAIVLNAETGETARVLSVEPGSRTALSAKERRFYTLSPAGVLSAYAADTAELLKTAHLDAGGPALHAFEGGVAVVNSDKVGFRLFSSDDLSPLWASHASQPVVWIGANTEWIVVLTEESEVITFRRG